MTTKKDIAIANKIKTVECGEKILNLRDYDKEIVIDLESTSKSMQHLAKDTCMLRDGVIKRLLKAKSFLPKDMKFKIVDGYRPLTAQKLIYKKLFSDIKKKHPVWSKDKIEAETDKFIADPSKVMPPHSTGGAIDLSIVDRNGKEIDMGTIVNYSGYKSAANAKGISEKAVKNRRILSRAMSKVGFINYEREWWHWSYGDWRWAAKKNKNAIYGSL